MRVPRPINPQTRADSGSLGYGQAVDISSGNRQLAAVVNDYSEYVAGEEKKRELFDVSRMLVDETNALQTDFEDKTKVAPLGAPDFTKQINLDYQTRHAQLTKNLRDSGYSDDAVTEFETRLATIRGQYVARAMDFQAKSQFTKVRTGARDLAVGLSQYANKNPNAVGSTLDEFRGALSHSGLDAIEQEQIFQQDREVILQGAREGFALQHPDIVLGLYGFPNELKVVQEPSTGQLVNLGTAQQTVATQFRDTGWNPNVIAGFLGNFHVEDGYTGKKGDGGKAQGIAQWHPERLANYERAMGKPFDPTDHETQAKFVIWEMQNPKAAGMTVAQRDKILAAKSPAEAAELIDKFYERSSGAHRSKRVEAAMRFVEAHADETIEALKPIPKGWKGNVEDAIQELGMTADQATEFLATGKDTRTATPKRMTLAADPEFVQQAGITINETGQTGIPAIDLSSSHERLQMLTLARTVMNEREANARAAQSAEHTAYLNDLYNGLLDGRYGQADVDSAYSSGKLTDYDERKKALDILKAKEKKQTDLERFGLMLRSGTKFNPFDDDAQKAADAGFAKAVEFDAASGGPAGPFNIALRTWQRTGILPKQGGVMIRGGLIGTDPKTVAAAASVASNMLKENPNAFAGVEGGDEIGKAAVTYTHYVDDLGMTAEQAAAKIATMNSPEFKVKLEANKVARDQLEATIIGDKKNAPVNIEKIINDSIVGRQSPLGRVAAGFGFGAQRGEFAKRQEDEARQTFLELALDNYDRYPDAEAAMANAARQMSRFYGIEGNRLIKYPPTKAYPEIAGSREYIYDQAKEFVDQQAGFDIPKENIWLEPTASGSTAAAFRAGKAPPYQIFYTTEVDGQPVLHHIPGKVFVADVNKARGDAAASARKVEQERRREVLIPGVGFVSGSGVR